MQVHFNYVMEQKFQKLPLSKFPALQYSMKLVFIELWLALGPLDSALDLALTLQLHPMTKY